MKLWQTTRQKILISSSILMVVLVVSGLIIYVFTKGDNRESPAAATEQNISEGVGSNTRATTDSPDESGVTNARPPAPKPSTSVGQPVAPGPTVSPSPNSTATSPPASNPPLSVPPPVTPPPSSPASVKPSAGNTGPRYALTRTMTSLEAEAELRTTGYLSRVHITEGTLDLESGWVLEDVKISGDSLYSVRAFTAGGVPSVKPIIRYAEVSGGGSSSACVYIKHTVVEYSDVSSCIDLFKLGSGATLRYSYAHDIFGVDGAHHDVVQIVSGTDIVVEWNNLIGIVTLGNAAGASRNASGVLQTGSLTGDIRRVYWYDNWVNGAGYTLRGIGAGDHSYTVEDYVFRRNKHGRTFTFGPITAMYSPATANSAWYYNDNIWEDTGQPIQP